MSEYEFDAVRWLRNNKGRIGTNRINGDDIATAIADEIHRLRAENATLRKESEFYRAQCDMRDEWRDKVEARVARLEEALQKIANGRGMIPDKSTVYMSGKSPEVPKIFNMYDMREIARRALGEKWA